MNVLQFQVTDKCYNHCAFCLKKQEKVPISTELIDIVMKNVLESKKEVGIESTRLVITGGDPLLLDKELLIHLFEQGYKAFDQIALNTSFCNLENLESIFGFFDPKKGEVLTSLHSCIEEIHTRISGNSKNYKAVVRGVSWCKARQIKVGINMVVDEKNWGQIEDMGHFAKNLGADFFFASPEINFLSRLNDQKLKDLFLRLEQIRIKENFYVDTEVCVTDDWFEQQELFDLKERFSRPVCPAISEGLYVISSGDVFPCLARPEIIGNLKTKRLLDIIRSSRLDRCMFRRERR